MLKKFLKFSRNEDGASAIEYGLIIGLIAVFLVVVLTLLGGGLDELFNKVVESLPGD